MAFNAPKIFSSEDLLTTFGIALLQAIQRRAERTLAISNLLTKSWAQTVREFISRKKAKEMTRQKVGVDCLMLSIHFVFMMFLRRVSSGLHAIVR